jgi:hypothetical protein
MIMSRSRMSGKDKAFLSGGRWTVDGGRWTVDGGRWTVDGVKPIFCRYLTRPAFDQQSVRAQTSINQWSSRWILLSRPSAKIQIF